MATLDDTALSTPRATDLLPGYQLERLVGRGGMGEVHRAIQLSLGRPVAVKLLSAVLARDTAFVARFHKEAAALAALSHPNIVSIVDKGEAGGTYYLVMEYVDGPSLREVMRTPLFDAQACLRVMIEMCRAIDYAHGRGVVHRDLKPENILFDEQAGGIPKVTDFGLASFSTDTTSRFALTSTHVAMGTVSYMAPEQRLDAKSADARADIFSLGVILYEMLAGEVPLGTFDPPSRRRPGLDPRLDAIVARCLKPDPADRYATVSELAAALEPLCPSATLRPLRPPSRTQRMKAAVGRAARRTVRVAAVTTVLAALGVLGVAHLRAQEADARLELPAGDTLTQDLGPPGAEPMTGRVEREAPSRRVALGEGPDTLSVVVAGRHVVQDGDALTFPPVGGQSRVGRATLDVVGLEGTTARLSARVALLPAERTLLARARAAVLGPPPEPRAALMLLGSAGRYVAFVHPGEGRPLALEWALGERRGSLLGHTAPAATLPLELSVAADGTLRAFVGTGPDRRPFGEPLQLGEGWMQHFGEPPVPAVGCIEGGCRAEGLAYAVTAPAAPAAPEPAAPAAAAAATPPAPAPVAPARAAPVRSTVTPAKGTAPKAAPVRKAAAQTQSPARKPTVRMPMPSTRSTTTTQRRK